MIRTGIVLVSLAVLAAPAAAQRIDTRATSFLKREITVTGDLVRIGDFIENAGAKANVAIFRAPDPGETGSVPVRQILDAIRVHQIVGVDTGDITEVSVTRAGRAFGSKEIEALLVQSLTALDKTTGTDNLQVSFDGELPTAHLEMGSAEPKLSRLNYDRRNGRFDVLLDLPGRRPQRLTGTALETVEVPVLVRPMNRGDLIKSSDLTTERRPKSEAGNDAVTSDTFAIGRAARRALRASQVLRAADLMKPEIVQRNDNVTIFFEAPGIMLTVRGKAMDSGAEGDVINVTNVQSKRVVQATIAGPGRVTVSVAARTPATLASAGNTNQSE
jgi:flagella basal body P-ring formation protein FlgA